MLHLIFKSPIDLATLERMTSGDEAVFLESGVLSVMQTGKLADVLINMLADNKFYILAEDMTTRGIQQAELIPGLEVIDYFGLVKLTVEHSLIQSWC